MKKRLFLVTIVLFASAGMVFAGGQSENSAPTKGPLTVGAKNFTEQYIMGQIMSQMLEANGFKVNQDFGMSSTVVRKALETARKQQKAKVEKKQKVEKKLKKRQKKAD